MDGSVECFVFFSGVVTSPREGGEAKVITVLPPSYSSLSRMGEIIDVLKKK